MLRVKSLIPKSSTVKILQIYKICVFFFYNDCFPASGSHKEEGKQKKLVKLKTSTYLSTSLLRGETPTWSATERAAAGFWRIVLEVC